MEYFDTDRRIERSTKIADEIRARIVDGRNKTAMDYGCGTGLVGLRLVNDFTSTRCSYWTRR